jgi:hypothetical protein
LAINGKRALQRFLASSEEEQRLLYIQLDQYGPSGVVRHQPRQAKSSPFFKLPGEIRNHIYSYLLPDAVAVRAKPFVGRFGATEIYLKKPSQMMDVNLRLRTEILSSITFDLSGIEPGLLGYLVRNPEKNYLSRIYKIRYQRQGWPGVFHLNIFDVDRNSEDVESSTDIGFLRNAREDFLRGEKDFFRLRFPDPFIEKVIEVRCEDTPTGYWPRYHQYRQFFKCLSNFCETQSEWLDENGESRDGRAGLVMIKLLIAIMRAMENFKEVEIDKKKGGDVAVVPLKSQ